MTMKPLETTKLIKAVTLLGATIGFSAQVLASSIDKDMPRSISELKGVFYGKTMKSKENVRAFISPRVEKPGTFFVALIIGDPKAQLFQAEAIGQDSLGLSPLGLSSVNDEMEIKAPPAAILQLVIKSGNKIDKIKITPQAGDQILGQIVELDSEYTKSKLLDQVPAGFFTDAGAFGSGKSQVTVGADAMVRSEVQNLNKLIGQFSLSYDMLGVGILRGVGIDGNYQKNEAEEVSGFLLAVQDSKTVNLVVGVPNGDGTAFTVVLLKMK